MSLYISINTASSLLADSHIDQAITFLAAHAALEKQQGRLPGGPSLDVTFMLPGEHETPPFVGMRMGGYTRESETLFFETAVPEHILKSVDATRYVAVVMQDVVEHAHEFFNDNHVEFDTQHWRNTIAKLTKSDQTSSTSH